MSAPSSISTAGIFSLGATPSADQSGPAAKTADTPAFAGLIDQTLSTESSTPQASPTDQKQTPDSKTNPAAGIPVFDVVQHEDEGQPPADENPSFVLTAFLLQFGTDQKTDPIGLGDVSSPILPAQKGKTMGTGCQPSHPVLQGTPVLVVTPDESTKEGATVSSPSDSQEKKAPDEDSNAASALLLSGFSAIPSLQIPQAIAVAVFAPQTDANIAKGDTAAPAIAAQTPPSAVQTKPPENGCTPFAGAFEVAGAPISLPPHLVPNTDAAANSAAYKNNTQLFATTKPLSQKDAVQETSQFSPPAPALKDGAPQSVSPLGPTLSQPAEWGAIQAADRRETSAPKNQVVSAAPETTHDKNSAAANALTFMRDIPNKSLASDLSSTLVTGWRMVQCGDATAAAAAKSVEPKLVCEGESATNAAGAALKLVGADAAKGMAEDTNSSPPEYGTGIANTANSMKVTDKMNKNDSTGLQKVPGEAHSVTYSEEKPQPTAMISHSANFHREGRDMAVESAVSSLLPQGSNGTVLTNGTTSSVSQRITNPILSEIATQVTHLRQTGLGALDVVIKPDRDTEIQLHVSVGRQGQVEVSAQMNRGDYNSFNAHWGEMQRSLSKQGIEVSQLGESAGRDAWAPGTSSGGFASPDQQRNSRRANEEELLAGVGAMTEPVKQSGLSSKTRRPSNREWWA